MKTLFLSVAVLIMTVVTSKANNIDDGVSVQSKEQFSKDFDQVQDVKWVRSDNYDEVTFTRKGQNLTAYYDAQSSLIGTTSIKRFTDLPASAQQEIKKKYKNYAIVSVLRYDDNEDNNTAFEMYGSMTDAPDSYFVLVSNNKEADVLHVTDDGDVIFYKALKSL
jgi:hypothetical protein